MTLTNVFIVSCIATSFLTNCRLKNSNPSSEIKGGEITLDINGTSQNAKMSQKINIIKNADSYCQFDRESTFNTGEIGENSFGPAMILKTVRNDGEELKLIDDYGWKLKKMSDLSVEVKNEKNLKLGKIVITERFLIYKRSEYMANPQVVSIETSISDYQNSQNIVEEGNIELGIYGGQNTISLAKYHQDTRVCLAALGAEHDTLDSKVEFRTKSYPTGDGGPAHCITFHFSDQDITPNMVLAAKEYLVNNSLSADDARNVCSR